MEHQNEKEEGEREEEGGEAKEIAGENREKVATMSRKEKRKAMKKMKRKQMRKEMAEKEKEEMEARLNDATEQERLRAIEEEEERKRERALKEFEERERAWMEAMELKRKEEEEEEAAAEREEEERRRKDIEESEKREASEKNESCEDDEWEYVEEGPPEIIFQGNEIILRKKKVRVPKQHSNEIVDRPTSNPLPPQSEDFADYQNASTAQQALENVAQQVPNFGTELDKAHCPFHLKTGACRFGLRCSRVHFYPDKSCTLLMKNMYNGPGIAWEQDEGLEYTDEEVERYYEEFYEDVHTEFLKYGEIVNFKVCRNGSFHLRGNVYVHYKSLESAVLAYQAINGRYFAGKQVKCEFVNVTRWKVAICGEYMKSRLETCSRGTACNFIHCFRNPGGDYEWADWDKPPPRYWVKKMIALFGYSNEYLEQMEHEHPRKLKDSRKVVSADPNRQRSRRSRSRDADHVNDGHRPSYRSREYHVDTWKRGGHHRLNRSQEYGDDESGSISYDTKENSDGEVNKDQWYAKRTTHRDGKWSEYSSGYQVTKKRTRQSDFDDEFSDEDKDRKRCLGYKRKSSRHHSRRSSGELGVRVDKEKKKRSHHSHASRSSRECSREGSSADHVDDDEGHGVDTTQDSYKRDREKHRHHRHERNRLEQLHETTDLRGEPDGLKNITYDIASPGEWSEEESAKGGRHEHKRRGSEPRDDVSKERHDQENNEMKSLDTDPTGYPSDRDWDKNRYHHHKRSSGHHNKIQDTSHNHRNSEQRKSSHKSNKKLDLEFDSDATRLGRSREGKVYNSHRRSSENGDSISESPEPNKNYRGCNDSAAIAERLDSKTHKERHHRHKRRHSTYHHRSSQSPEKDTCADPQYNESESGACISRDEVVCETEKYTDWMERWRP